MKYLVTGGAGFIGSHIVRTLLEQGDSVRVLDNFSTGKRENIDGLIQQFNGARLEVLEGDLRDALRVEEAVHGVDVIFHEAAFVGNGKKSEFGHANRFLFAVAMCSKRETAPPPAAK